MYFSVYKEILEIYSSSSVLRVVCYYLYVYKLNGGPIGFGGSRPSSTTGKIIYHIKNKLSHTQTSLYGRKERTFAYSLKCIRASEIEGKRGDGLNRGLRGLF